MELAIWGRFKLGLLHYNEEVCPPPFAPQLRLRRLRMKFKAFTNCTFILKNFIDINPAQNLAVFIWILLRSELDG